MANDEPTPGGPDPLPGSAKGSPEKGEPAPPAPIADAEAALDAAQQAVTNLKNNVGNQRQTTGAPAAANPDEPAPFEPEVFGRPTGAATSAGIDLLSDVNLNVKIELGRTRMLVEDVLRLAEGAVIELDKLAGDPVDVYVNDRHIARGEVLVLNDTFCVRVNEIVQQGGGEPSPKKK